MQPSRKRAHPDTIAIRSGRTGVRPARAQQCRQAGQRRNTPARDSSNTAAPGDGRTPAAVSRCARVGVVYSWASRICNLSDELSDPTVFSRRAGGFAADHLSSHPAHNTRAHPVQLADVPSTFAAAPDAPQPARTYFAPAVALPGYLFAGTGLCPAIF